MKRRDRPGWEALGVPGAKGRTYRHASGWEVQHCGHPTALWPYYLVDPARPTLLIVSFNGLGFRLLETAMVVVERIVRGEIRVHTRGTKARAWIDAGGQTPHDPEPKSAVVA